MDDFAAFLAWERASRDVIDVKRVYVDMAGDLVSGVMLSQIVFWHLPNRDGSTKLQVEKDGHRWLVKSREEWWDECRITDQQARRVIPALVKLGLIEVRIYQFRGAPTAHIRIVRERFLAALKDQVGGYSDIVENQSIWSIPPNGLSSNHQNHLVDSTKSSGTETTTEITSEKREEAPPAIPSELDTEDFRKAWGEWKAERSDRKKKYTPRGEKAALGQLAPFGPKVSIAAIKLSIASGWQGLFPEKISFPGIAPPKPPLIDPPVKRARDIPAMHFGKEPTWEEVNGYGKS